MPGDNIYNGAADNATGCGMLIELARAWSHSHVRHEPPHSVIFAAVTAEEQGLLGSEYLGQHPPIPAGQIALDINYDMILPIGVPLEVNVNGAQRTSFYPTVEATAKRFDLAIVPDPKPPPAATTAPTTSPSLASASPPSPSTRHPLRRPRPRLGQKPNTTTSPPTTITTSPTTTTPTGTSPATPNSTASASTSAGKPSPPPPPSTGSPATNSRPPAKPALLKTESPPRFADTQYRIHSMHPAGAFPA